MSQNHLQIKRADVVLAVLVLLAAAALFLCGRLRGYGTSADYVIVRVDDAEYGRYPLSQDTVVKIETPYGTNELTIQNGTARITAADCAGGDCMHMSPVTAQGGTIICLPHHVTITSASGNSGMDVLAQ